MTELAGKGQTTGRCRRRLMAIPTTTTTTAPTRLCQRNAIGVVRATMRTTTVPAIEIDDGRSRQRVQLSGAGRHRGREDGGNHQADQTDRHPRRDEGRKDV